MFDGTAVRALADLGAPGGCERTCRPEPAVSSKGDYDGAMTQYLKTIGRLEPSYVIRKVRRRRP